MGNNINETKYFITQNSKQDLIDKGFDQGFTAGATFGFLITSLVAIAFFYVTNKLKN